MKLTYEAILTNPELLQRTLAEARRERALAIHRLAIAPVIEAIKAPFTKQPPLRYTRMIRRSAFR